MRSFNTLVEAMNTLREEGYTRDFNLRSNWVECDESKECLKVGDFLVHEFYRFEGMSNPEDNMILYAIEAQNKTKGLFLQAYGADASILSAEMAQHLQMKP